MPFLQYGGLFFTSYASYLLDDQVLLVLKLPNHEQPFINVCKVVWREAREGKSGTCVGIGIQFTAVDDSPQNAILNLLADNAISLPECFQAN